MSFSFSVLSLSSCCQWLPCAWCLCAFTVCKCVHVSVCVVCVHVLLNVCLGMLDVLVDTLLSPSLPSLPRLGTSLHIYMCPLISSYGIWVFCLSCLLACQLAVIIAAGDVCVGLIRCLNARNSIIPYHRKPHMGTLHDPRQENELAYVCVCVCVCVCVRTRLCVCVTMCVCVCA